MTRDVPSLDAIEAILFDLDGTLVETSNRWGEMIARQLLFLKRPFPALIPKSSGGRWSQRSRCPATMSSRSSSGLA